jgi:hypothetical protein
MEARVFIEEDFFETFQKFQPTKGLGVEDITTENKNQLINILSSSELNSPVPKKYFINLHKKLKQNYKPDNLKDYIFFKAFRNNKFKIKETEFNASNSIFLLGKTYQEIMPLCEENNIISQGSDYDFQDPIIPKSFASKLVDKNMNGIECIKHRCRNVIVIEPYIFEDQPKFEPKTPNLIRFLKELYLHNDKTQCHLSIITTEQDNDVKFKSKIKQIADGLGNINLDISIYTHKKGLFQNNRHFITDYSIIDSQHLFDRDGASVSVNFLYHGDINANFLRVQKLKEQILFNYSKDPIKMGVYTRKFGDILNNPLFQ